MNTVARGSVGLRIDRVARSRVIATILVSIVAVGLAACTVGRPSSTVSATHSVSATKKTSYPPLEGRASTPSDLTAPGVQPPPGGSLDLTVQSLSLSIPTSDWNTIIASTVVPPQVGSQLDPQFNETETTEKRFQYLANRIFDVAKTIKLPDGLTLIDIGSHPNERKFVDIAAFYNPHHLPILLQNVTATASDTDGSPLASGKFYPPPNSTVSIPAMTIYFAWLELDLAPDKSGGGSTVNLDINYDSGTCLKAICRAGSG